jgi:hypothetical protein
LTPLRCIMKVKKETSASQHAMRVRVLTFSVDYKT